MFHLQFACHVAKLILTHFRVDTFLVNCTYCLFAFQSERERDVKRDTGRYADVWMLVINVLPIKGCQIT